jgi:hypothetical protein
MRVKVRRKVKRRGSTTGRRKISMSGKENALNGGVGKNMRDGMRWPGIGFLCIR